MSKNEICDANAKRYMVRKEESTACHDAIVKLDIPPAEMLCLILGPTAASEMEIWWFSPGMASQFYHSPNVTTSVFEFDLNFQQ